MTRHLLLRPTNYIYFPISKSEGICWLPAYYRLLFQKLFQCFHSLQFQLIKCNGYEVAVSCSKANWINKNTDRRRNVHLESLDLLVELNSQLVQGDVIHLNEIIFCVVIYKIYRSMRLAWTFFIFTYWIELFHGNRFVVHETFVHSAKASLSESAAAAWYWTVVKVACNLHQLIVQETGET